MFKRRYLSLFVWVSNHVTFYLTFYLVLKSKIMNILKLKGLYYNSLVTKKDGRKLYYNEQNF